LNWSLRNDHPLVCRSLWNLAAMAATESSTPSGSCSQRPAANQAPATVVRNTTDGSARSADPSPWASSSGLRTRGSPLHGGRQRENDHHARR
jgi:hypothetical protein